MLQSLGLKEMDLTERQQQKNLNSVGVLVIIKVLGFFFLSSLSPELYISSDAKFSLFKNSL